MEQFRRLGDKFPNSPEVLNYHGELMLDQQNYEGAVAKFESSIALDINRFVFTTSLSFDILTDTMLLFVVTLEMFSL